MGLIKICGFTRPQDVLDALDLGVDMVGFVAVPDTPRFVTPEAYRAMASFARGRAHVVLLSVNASPAFLAPYMQAVRPDVFQAHGDEPPLFLKDLKQRYGFAICKALACDAQLTPERVATYGEVADLLLLDAPPPSSAGVMRGGHGVAFDDDAVPAFAFPCPFLLAGGLNAQTVKARILRVRPSGVDVSSGVESSKGLKSVDLMAQFVAEARAGFALAAC